MARTSMPRPWSSILQACYPWLVCLACALGLLGLCAVAGCGGVHGWRQAEEHPPGGAWFVEWDRVPLSPKAAPMWIQKIRATPDQSATLIVIGNYGPDEVDPASPTGEAYPWVMFPFVYVLRTHGPLPLMAEQDSSEATGTGGGSECPYHVRVIEAEDGAARLGVWW